MTSGLKKVLGPFDLLMMGVGCIIGVGIYILSGVASAKYAGPAVIISFLLAGALCAIVALCYGELASMFPVAGSAYSYSYYAFGRAAAWILGWTLLLEYAIACSAVASGWSSYFQKFLKSLFGLNLPKVITSVPGSIEGHFSVNLPSVFVMAFVIVLAVLGTKESAKFNNVMAVLKICVLLFFVCYCLPAVNPANWQPFIPERIFTIEGSGKLFELTLFNFIKGLFSGETLQKVISESARFWHYGKEGILSGAAIVFFTYVGFDMVSSVAEETKNPQRDVPIGIIGSLLIATGLYILVTLVLTGVVPPVVNGLPNPALVGTDAAAPLAIAVEAASKGGSNLPSLLLSFGALAGVTTSLLTLSLALSRVLLAISRDNFLPNFLASIHPKFRTPHIATVIVGSLVALVSAVLPIGKLAELCNLGTLAAFCFVCISVIALRKKLPEKKRAFKCPLVPVLPILGTAFCLVLMASLPVLTWLWFGGWLLLGLVIYYAYSRRRVSKFPVVSY